MVQDNAVGVSKEAGWLFVPALLFLLSVSCDGRPLPANDEGATSGLLQAGQVTLTIPLPAGTPLSSVALAANSTLLIGSNVTVAEEASTSAQPIIVNTGTGTTSTTQTGVSLNADVWSVGSVFLATGTTVSGSVTTGGSLTQQSGVTIGGIISQNQSLTPAPTTIGITFPSSSTNVTLQPGQTSSIVPGALSAVTVNSRATLTLQSGTYYFDSIDVEPQGTIALSGSGPFVLNVRTSFMAKGQLLLPANSPPATLVLVDAGTSDVFLQAEFDGTLIAPNANVTLAALAVGSSYHGAFIGKSLTLQAGVQMVHRGTGAGTVVPIAECIITQSSGALEAVFGYSSSALLGNITIPLGANNSFEPAPATRGQPQVFSPGRHTAQFAVPFDGHALTWQLDGISSTASAALPQCNPTCVQQLTDSSKPRIDSVLPTAAVPLSLDESIVQRDAFRWSDALPVPETFADGTARIYYGLVYMNSQSALQTMDALRLNYDNVPMFDPETQALQQQGITVLSYPFDGQGEFAFALVPGATYNAIRQAALDPTQPMEVFQALQLRSMPSTDAQLAVQTSCGLQPVAQCVARGSNGALRAVFSYSNPSGGSVTVPIGPDNSLTGGPTGTLQPEAFAAGTHTAVFAVPLATGATVSWQLSGQTVSLSSSSPICSTTLVNEIGVDHFSPFPPAATPSCRSATPAEAQFPGSQLPPAARINTCNSLSYQYAGTLGFLWRGVASDAADTSAQAADAALALQDASPPMGATSQTVVTGSTATVRSALFGKLFHKLVQAIVQTSSTAIDGVRRGLTSAAGFFVGSANITINTSVLNTDPALNPPPPQKPALPPPGTPMLQAWGANFGKPISLQGVQVRASKSILLSVASLDSTNHGNVKVLNRLGAHICFNLTNNAAQMVDFTTLPLTVCPTGVDAQITTSTTSPHTVTVQNANVNAMAQMTDAHLYLSNAAGATVTQAEVLTGTVANMIGFFNGDRAFTPCWSFSWANDVSTFMTALGAVAADHADVYAMQHLEIGAVYLEKGLAYVVSNGSVILNDLQSANTMLNGTSMAPMVSAAIAAQNSALAQLQAAQTQATLLAQNAGDLVGSVGTAARLGASGSSGATAASNTAQAALNQVGPQVAPTSAEIQAALIAAQNAEVAIQALANALTSSSETAAIAAVSAADTIANQVATSIPNYLNIVETVVSDATEIGADTIGALIGNYLGNTIGQVLEAFATADMILTAHNDDHNFSDRGIATHEYGHFGLCNLMDSVNGAAFAVAYDEAAAAGFLTGQSPSATGSVLNESFADLIASQVMGGTNYASPTTDVSLPSNMSYCSAIATGCVEDNWTNINTNESIPADAGAPSGTPTPTFDQEVLRDVSLFTDAFDGRIFPPNVDAPTNGNEWIFGGVSSIQLAATPGLSAQDETVALQGKAFSSWIAHALSLGQLLREDNVFAGLSDAMIEQNYNWCQRCQVFELHTVDSTGTPTCPEAWVGPRPMSLVCTFDPGGCPAGTTADPTTSTCKLVITVG